MNTGGDLFNSGTDLGQKLGLSFMNPEVALLQDVVQAHKLQAVLSDLFSGLLCQTMTNNISTLYGIATTADAA